MPITHTFPIVLENFHQDKPYNGSEDKSQYISKGENCMVVIRPK